MLTFHKPVSKLNFGEWIRDGSYTFRAQYIRHNHIRSYISGRKRHLVSNHIHDCMSMYLVRYSCLCHTVDRKQAHKIYPFYLMCSRACKYIYCLCNHRFHNLKMNFVCFVFQISLITLFMVSHRWDMLAHKNRLNSLHDLGSKCIHLVQNIFHWYIPWNRSDYICERYGHHVHSLDSTQ